MAYNEKNEILADVVVYLETVLVSECLSERAEAQRQQLLKKLSYNRESSPARGPYMDMNGRSKGLITKSNSFACLHQQAAYEELCMIQPIYNNVPYEDDILNYEPFVMNGYCPPKHLNVAKRHSAPNGGGGGGGGRDSNSSIGSLNKSALNGSSLSSRSNSDSSESSKSGDVIYVSANAVKYSASKYGILMKREKILFVDHTRKYWAAVLSSTMYVYNGEKELKPCLVVHLEGYTARDLNGSSGNRNKDWVFEVVCPGKKTYQFIAQNQEDMRSWIEAIGNSNGSKPSTPEIANSPSPICFKQELLPNRELPVPPVADATALDYCYDKPNPIIRAVNLYENAADEVDAESIYYFIDESQREKDVLPKVYHYCRINEVDEQLWDGDTSYYNTPSNIPVPPTKGEDRNNNDVMVENGSGGDGGGGGGDDDDYFVEKETGYDVVITSDEREEVIANPVLGVQQIIQKIEENSKKTSSPLLRRKSRPMCDDNGLLRNSMPVYHHHHHHHHRHTTHEFFDLMKPTKTMPTSNNVAAINGAPPPQSFRKCR